MMMMITQLWNSGCNTQHDISLLYVSLYRSKVSLSLSLIISLLIEECWWTCDDDDNGMPIQREAYAFPVSFFPLPDMIDSVFHDIRHTYVHPSFFSTVYIYIYIEYIYIYIEVAEERRGMNWIIHPKKKKEYSKNVTQAWTFIAGTCDPSTLPLLSLLFITETSY